MSCPENDFQYYCKRLKRSVYFDYYDLLQVDSSASEEEIKKAYRSLARRYHPDRCVDSSKEMSKEKFKFISDAYTNLVDPIKRAAYNQFLLHMALKKKIKTCDVQGVSSVLQSCQSDELMGLLCKKFAERTQNPQPKETQNYPNWQFPQYEGQQQQQSKKHCPYEQQKQEQNQKIHEFIWQMKKQFCQKEQEMQQQQHNQASSNVADILGGTTNDDSSTSGSNNNSVDDAISDETDEQQPPCRANNIGSSVFTATPSEFAFYQRFPMVHPTNFQLPEGKIQCSTVITPESNNDNNIQSSTSSCPSKLISEPQNAIVIPEEAQFDQSAETVVRTPLTKAHILQIQRATKEKKLVNRIRSKKSIFSCVPIAKKSIRKLQS